MCAVYCTTQSYSSGCVRSSVYVPFFYKTGTPAFWEYPPPMITHTFDQFILLILSILNRTFHATHILKLLDKVCKYEMDPASIVEETDWTRFRPQMDTQAGKVKPVYPLQLRWAGYNYVLYWQKWSQLFYADIFLNIINVSRYKYSIMSVSDKTMRCTGVALQQNVPTSACWYILKQEQCFTI